MWNVEEENQIHDYFETQEYIKNGPSILPASLYVFVSGGITLSLPRLERRDAKQLVSSKIHFKIHIIDHQDKNILFLPGEVIFTCVLVP